MTSIPVGWALCDGNNGTPDLRDRFIIGATSTYAPGATGGVNMHVHAFGFGSHKHFIPAGSGLATGPLYQNQTYNSNIAGTTDQESLLPNYYALAFIMQLP